MRDCRAWPCAVTRLELLCRAYAAGGDRVEIRTRDVLLTAIDRLEDLARFTAGRAAAGASQVAAHVPIYREDARWLEKHLDELGPAN